ncbi:hypothetical protein Sa4125_25410 [Aureimonas sp. SA4125]|uniref:hypothetical protein n=1 Tax=Aureimonas sp. SA4125 TaxID=2826993 RepID=UPI001CC5342A|nr:hypothetical protein [Aureimonas sp. SA4125]BDA84999.1 hypothetical protein Sa4125_25410 [Aureimonas sp. SA4125]
MIETRSLTASERAARDNASPAISAEPPSTAERMAAHMLDIAAGNGEACLDSDLLLRGFTPGELRHHGVEANRIARLRSGGGLC